MSLDYFTNDKYKVLSCTAERQIPVNEEYIIKLSQQEISSIVGISKVKVNSIISELKKDGYLVSKNLKGKYQLTDKAVTQLSDMQVGGRIK